MWQTAVVSDRMGIITSDRDILGTVTGLRIDFLLKPVQNYKPNKHQFSHSGDLHQH